MPNFQRVKFNLTHLQTSPQIFTLNCNRGLYFGQYGIDKFYRYEFLHPKWSISIIAYNYKLKFCKKYFGHNWITQIEIGIKISAEEYFIQN